MFKYGLFRNQVNCRGSRKQLERCVRKIPSQYIKDLIISSLKCQKQRQGISTRIFKWRNLRNKHITPEHYVVHVKSLKRSNLTLNLIALSIVIHLGVLWSWYNTCGTRFCVCKNDSSWRSPNAWMYSSIKNRRCFSLFTSINTFMRFLCINTCQAMGILKKTSILV